MRYNKDGMIHLWWSWINEAIFILFITASDEIEQHVASCPSNCPLFDLRWALILRSSVMVSPRYLYSEHISRIASPRYHNWCTVAPWWLNIMIFDLDTLISKHRRHKNLKVASSIFWSIFESSANKIMSSINNREDRSIEPYSTPRHNCLRTLSSSSIIFENSTTERTPPCLTPPLTCTTRVRPNLVEILVVISVESFNMTLQILPLIPQSHKILKMISLHALS